MSRAARITSTQSRRYNVDHVTITVNMVDPEVGAKIYPGFLEKQARHRHRGAKILTSARCKV